MQRCVVCFVLQCVGCAVDHGLGDFDAAPSVDHAVLHGLEGTDGGAELFARLGVLDPHIDHRLAHAEKEGSGGEGTAVFGFLQEALCGGAFGEFDFRGAVVFESEESAGAVGALGGWDRKSTRLNYSHVANSNSVM